MTLNMPSILQHCQGGNISSDTEQTIGRATGRVSVREFF